MSASGLATAAGAARRLPTSGIRPRPRGQAFDGTGTIRRPRRIIGIMIVLLLIGIGVALGVAFSGPELEVTDPTLPALSSQSGQSAGSVGGTAAGTPAGAPVGAAAGAAPSGAALRQAPAPSELPGPPAATSGTP